MNEKSGIESGAEYCQCDGGILCGDCHRPILQAAPEPAGDEQRPSLALLTAEVDRLTVQLEKSQKRGQDLREANREIAVENHRLGQENYRLRRERENLLGERGNLDRILASVTAPHRRDGRNVPLLERAKILLKENVRLKQERVAVMKIEQTHGIEGVEEAVREFAKVKLRHEPGRDSSEIEGHLPGQQLREQSLEDRDGAQ